MRQLIHDHMTFMTTDVVHASWYDFRYVLLQGNAERDEKYIVCLMDISLWRFLNFGVAVALGYHNVGLYFCRFKPLSLDPSNSVLLHLRYSALCAKTNGIRHCFCGRLHKRALLRVCLACQVSLQL